MVRSLIVLMLLGSVTSFANAQSREEKVQADKRKIEAAGVWIYNDLPRGFREAKQSGKPLIVVLRCIPCEECVKLDDELLDADPQLKPLLEKFVRVRQVSTNGLDLSLFQYDYDQSFAVFLLNGDGTIYGRFGTRSSRKEWIGDVSIEGLGEALRGALELHAGYPANKEKLAAKRGPAPVVSAPENFPTLKERYNSKIDFTKPVVQKCIHCHQIGDALRDWHRQNGGTIPEQVLFSYPHPRVVGLTLDPQHKARVLRVEPKSPAAQAGLLPGDDILSLAGQPLLSIADVQWVLHHAQADGAKIAGSIRRGGKQRDVTLVLPKGWRRGDDISWRASTWELRRSALGGMLLNSLDDEGRTKLKIDPKSMALVIGHVGQYAPHNIAQQAGFMKGDVLVSFAGRTDLLRETDLIAFSLNEKERKQPVAVKILREGKPKSLTLPLNR